VNNLLKDQDSQKLKIELLQSQLLDTTERLDVFQTASNPNEKRDSNPSGPSATDSDYSNSFQSHDREIKRIKDYLEAMQEQDENQTMTLRYMSETMKNNYDNLENNINEKLELLASTMDTKLTNLPGICNEIDSKLDLKLAELAEKLLNNPKQGF
jgi:DNA-binding transcriptional MerR regulator